MQLRDEYANVLNKIHPVKLMNEKRMDDQPGFREREEEIEEKVCRNPSNQDMLLYINDKLKLFKQDSFD